MRSRLASKASKGTEVTEARPEKKRLFWGKDRPIKVNGPDQRLHPRPEEISLQLIQVGDPLEGRAFFSRLSQGLNRFRSLRSTAILGRLVGLLVVYVLAYLWVSLWFAGSDVDFWAFDLIVGSILPVMIVLLAMTFPQPAFWLGLLCLLGLGGAFLIPPLREEMVQAISQEGDNFLTSLKLALPQLQIPVPALEDIAPILREQMVQHLQLVFFNVALVFYLLCYWYYPSELLCLFFFTLPALIVTGQAPWKEFLVRLAAGYLICLTAGSTGSHGFFWRIVMGMNPFSSTQEGNPGTRLSFVEGLQAGIQASWQERRHRNGLAPCAILLALTMLLGQFLPPDFLRNKALAEAFDQMKLKLSASQDPDVVNYFEFSIRQLGYYPKVSKLGGSIQPKDEAFIQVLGPKEGFYLRGAIFDTYANSLWTMSSMDPNYIFMNLFNEYGEKRRQIPPEQVKAFSYGPNGEMDKNFYFYSDLVVVPLRPPLQTVFNGGAPWQLTEDQSSKYYFNSAGQLYASHSLSPNGLTVAGWIAKTGPQFHLADQLRAAMTHTSFRSNPHPSPLNLDIIARDDPTLFDLIQAGAASRNPQDKLEDLLKIREHFRKEYSYSYEVSDGDRGDGSGRSTDFLTQFFHDKRGYCVYFGTAMTLSAWAIGVDARYVEGMLVPGKTTNPAAFNSPDFESTEKESRMILDRDAHAWTEIYLEGIGWIPFDATPASYFEGRAGDEEGGGTPPQGTTRPTEPSAPPPDASHPSSETTTTPPPPPGMQGMPSTEPTKTLDNRNREEETTSAPDATTEETQPNEAQSQENQEKMTLDKLYPILMGLVVLLILALLAFFLWRANERYKHRYDYDPNASPEALRAKFLAYWNRARTLYEKVEKTIPVDMTPTAFFEELNRKFLTQSGNPMEAGQRDRMEAFFSSLIYACDLVFYADADTLPEDIDLMIQLNEMLEQKVRASLSRRAAWTYLVLTLSRSPKPNQLSGKHQHPKHKPDKSQPNKK